MKSAGSDRNKPERVTQRTIAERCGVQVATVSRVLNNVKSGFSVLPEKREQILATARELGYMPNSAARNLRRSRSGRIVVLGYSLFWDPDDSTYSQMLRHCIEECNRHGYQVDLVFPPDPRELLAPGACDGAVIVNLMRRNLNREFRHYGIPYVLMNSRGDEDEAFVTADDRGGIALAIRRLCKLGHRRLAYFGASNLFKGKTHSSVQDRFEGFLDACRTEGLADPITETAEETDAESFLEHILSRNVTGVVSYNQLGGILLYRACRKMGVRVPEDLNIIAFNRLFDFFEPHLTTLVFDLESMGKATAKLLIDQIEHGAEPRGITFPLSLEEGESTAPPDDARNYQKTLLSSFDKTIASI